MASFSSKHGVDDMVMLTSISNDSICDNLKKRFNADIIYTYIGHVLIAVNPYKAIDQLYTERTIRDYRGKYRYELPPHVYCLADTMYRNMLSEGENQCVIISGESGAGKTWTAKKIMQYIAAVSGAQSDAMRVKDVILESNPLLEAFGNAATLRNHNSSRFGKYMEIHFDLRGDPEGGRINNYLLEKSRVVYQQKGERNFHIFYQILAGCPQNMRDELGLTMGPDYFHYTNQSNTYTVPGTDDRKEFEDTQNAMKTIGFSQQEISDIFRLVAAILYLGNIEFVPDAKGSSNITDRGVIDMVAYLLQSTAQACEQALLFRTITTGVQGRGRSSVYACPQEPEGAYYSRDALSKALYSRMFDYIVARVNDAMYIEDSEALTLGILDIYGFEIFGKNGFEQLCINFVNERLQQIFIQLTLKAEQEEYASEGIQWENIDYFNNKICCDLIESKKPPGLMMLLDDVCNFPKGTDLKFLQKIKECYTGHAHFNSTSNPDEFIVKHYAGDVIYNVDGFCDKNKDLLFKDLVGLAECTSSQFIAGLFPEAKEVVSSKKKPTTAGFKIKESIGDLVAALSACQPHYIRCVKPNEKKAANLFEHNLNLHQVKYLGLLENVRIRRAGYAYRQFYDKFFYRYRVVCPKTFPHWQGDHVAGTEAILQHVNMALGKEYQKGRSKVFIRHPESLFSLEELRDRTVFEYANRIQRFLQKTSMRRYFYELTKGVNDRFQNNKERRRLSLERKFKFDYIKYRQNFKLKDCIGDRGTEKILFADVCNRFDKTFFSSKQERRIIIVTLNTVYLIAIDQNKDKEARKTKPFLYQIKRSIPVNKLAGIVLSPYQDNFFCVNVTGEHANLLECRRKTELVGLLMKHFNVNVSFTDVMSVVLKANAKPTTVKFMLDPSGGDLGRLKGTKVLVASGLPKTSAPNLQPPPMEGGQSFVTEEASYKEQILLSRSTGQRGVGGGGRGMSRGGGGGARPSPRGGPRGGGGGGGMRGGGMPRGGGGPPPSAGPGQEQVKALYDFSAENDDELEFSAGQVIVLLNKSNPDWWEGEMGGRRGVFPATYVEPIASAPSPAPMTASRGRPSPPMGGGGRGVSPPRGRGGPPRGGGRGASPPRGRGGPPRGAPRGRGGPPRGAPRGRGMPPPRGRGMPPPGM